MPSEQSVDLLFVVNPISGGKPKTDWEKAIIEYFNPLALNINFHFLNGKNDNTSVKNKIEKIKPVKVVAVGGDGTVSLVARQVMGTGIPLGILPAGSANGMAKELGIPQTVFESIRITAEGNIKNADVIKINEDKFCIHLSDIGLNAQLIKNFEEGKLRGKLGYAIHAIKTLSAKSDMRVKIKTEEKEVSVFALMVVLANARKYGTGAIINPEGNLFDGRFEVVIVKRLAVSELFKMWFNPHLFDPRKIKVYPATSVFIKTLRKVHFQVDGEYLGKVNQIEATILPGQLKLIVP